MQIKIADALPADALPDVGADGALAADVDDSVGRAPASDDAWGDWLAEAVNRRCLDCGRTGPQVSRYGHGTDCDYAD